MRARLGVLLGAAALAFAIAIPAAAVAPLGPPVIVSDSGCLDTLGNADMAVASDGVIRGFVGFYNCEDPLAYLEGSGRSWNRIVTPYIGQVIAVAYDGTATYLLYTSGDSMYVAKHGNDGTFAPSELLSSTADISSGGDILAANGTWWAVWREGAGSGGELYQAKSYGTDVSRQRITFNGVVDHHPTLALLPGVGAVLVWARGEGPGGFPDREHLRLATSTDGSWSSRALATIGVNDSFPDVFTYVGTTYVAFQRDNHPVVANDGGSGTARFTSFRFPQAGFSPTVGASLGRTFVAWTNFVGTTSSDHTFLAQNDGAGWSVADVSAEPALNQSALRVVARAGRATVLALRQGSPTRTGLAWVRFQP